LASLFVGLIWEFLLFFNASVAAIRCHGLSGLFARLSHFFTGWVVVQQELASRQPFFQLLERIKRFFKLNLNRSSRG
jgi:hypothetical protein